MKAKNHVTRDEARRIDAATKTPWRTWEKRIERLLKANHFDVEHQRPHDTREGNARSHKRGKADFLAVGKVGTPSEGKVIVLEAKTGKATASEGQEEYLERWSRVPGVAVCAVVYPHQYGWLVRQLGGKEPV